MAERLIDIQLELDPLRLAAEPDPVRTIAELARHEAEATVSTMGRLRHPEPVEITSKQAINALTGRDVMLVATRWVVDTWQ